MNFLSNFEHTEEDRRGFRVIRVQHWIASVNFFYRILNKPTILGNAWACTFDRESGGLRVIIYQNWVRSHVLKILYLHFFKGRREFSVEPNYGCVDRVQSLPVYGNVCIRTGIVIITSQYVGRSMHYNTTFLKI